VIPDDFRDDIERLVANDAARRRDGMIADSVVESDALMLRRAYERQGRKDAPRGLAALRCGIDIALDKGKGVRFAAGCVRNYDPVRDDRRPPALFDHGVTSLSSRRTAPSATIPETADPAVFAELARPGEDFETCSRRLRVEDRDGWNRLNRLRKRDPISA
jgi:hypothetical protein